LPDEVVAFYEALIEHAAGFEEIDGQWTEDYGDAPFYGQAMYTHLGLERGDDAMLQTAQRARTHNLEVLRQANGDVDWYIAHMEEALMAALGLIEGIGATGDTTFVGELDAFIDTTDEFVHLFGDYLPLGTDVGSFALETYGPTAITAGAALLHLQYATYVQGPAVEERIGRAEQIVAAIDRRAWDGERYLFEPGVDRPYLYPSSMMMLVLLRLYELTEERDYLARAVEVAESIAPLRSDRGGYLSPYSAEAMGATTDDYSTLSSQNYLALALTLLYQHTRDLRWYDETLFVLDFARTRLFDAEQGRLLHHFMDGRIAQPEDPSYFCSGCNLQFVYVVWYLRTKVLAPLTR
jgi:hypothetical protein